MQGYLVQIRVNGQWENHFHCDEREDAEDERDDQRDGGTPARIIRDTTIQQPAGAVMSTTANPHDGGYDLVTGNYILGSERIGIVYWDSDSPSPGLVLRVDGDDETYLPDDVAEVQSILAAHGFRLADSSLADVEMLTREDTDASDLTTNPEGS